MGLLLTIIIVLALTGLVLVNMRNDGFGYILGDGNERPYFEREKHERLNPSYQHNGKRSI